MASYKDVDYSYLGVEGLHGDYMVRVSNLSRKRVQYVIPELNKLRREFTPAQGNIIDTKVISFHELYLLNNSSGGPKIIYDNLQIKDNDVRKALNLPEDPEFDYSIEDIRKLIVEGTEDEILDALEFGPFFIASQMKGILVAEKIGIDYSRIEFFEGLFRTNFKALKDNFEWSKTDPQLGSVYRAMEANAVENNRRRRAGAKDVVEAAETKTSTRRTTPKPKK